MSIAEAPVIESPIVVETPARIARDWVLPFALAMLGCATIFAVLHHPSWVRGGDSDVYIGLSRSIATGQGYRFNGQPISLVPPLWPYVLAGAMKLTTSFAMLKLLPITLLLIALAAWYFVLLRVARPSVAAIILVVTALCSNVFELTFWFHSEPMFCALAAPALLLAMQIGEGRAKRWRIALLAVLCAGFVSVRWAGLIYWPIIAAALLNGDWRPRFDRRWLAVLLSAAVTIVMFFTWRAVLRVGPEQIDPRFDSTLSTSYDAVNVAVSPEDYVRRFSEAGRWMSSLLWPLFMATTATKAIVDVIGWAAVALMYVAAIHSLRTRRWLFAAVALYCTILFVNWTSPVARYLVPVAPLLIAAMLCGLDRARRIFVPHVERRIARFGPPIVVGSIIFSGLCMWGIEARVARSSNFPKRVFGGTDRGLVAIAQYLNSQGIRDADVAVSKAYTNFGYTRFTNEWMRAMNMLSGGVSIKTVTGSRSREPDKQVMALLHRHGAKYYLYHAPQWLRFTHFNRKDPPRTKRRQLPEWQLYEVSGAKPRLIEVPIDDVRWPTHVPMLSSSPAEQPAEHD